MKQIIKKVLPEQLLRCYMKLRGLLKMLLYKCLPERLRPKVYLFFLRRSADKRLAVKKLLSFEVNVADHCNLNCRGCEHFSPLVKESYINIDNYARDCARLSELTGGHIDAIHLMGGEPLLYSRLLEIFSITRKAFPVGNIMLVTNGLLLLSQPADFWQRCKQNGIAIFITQYPIKLDYKKIEKTARQYGLKIQYYFSGTKTLQCRPLDLAGRQNIADNFRICHMANNCIQLQNGKLYTCVLPPYIKFFNEYYTKDILVTEQDYIDIYKVNDINEILNFLNKPIPFCRYCNIKNISLDIKWTVSKKDIKEWVGNEQ